MKNLNYFNRLINIMCLSALIVLCAGCQKAPDSQTDPDSSIPENVMQTEPELITDPGADSGAGSETPTPTNAPFPESDMNAVNFNDGNHAFVKIPDTGAAGELSVENVDGNFMLKFTDLSTNSENLAESVQEIQVSAGQLLNPDQLESVRKIGFDFYVKAKEDLYQNEAGESLRVPGAISINGTTLCTDGTFYEFEGFSAGDVKQYNLERSDACHVEFEFLLAESGKCWDSSIETEKLYFTIRRIGMENISDSYLDNLVFYDAEGNSIPLHIRAENFTETTQE